MQDNIYLVLNLHFTSLNYKFDDFYLQDLIYHAQEKNEKRQEKVRLEVIGVFFQCNITYSHF